MKLKKHEQKALISFVFIVLTGGLYLIYILVKFLLKTLTFSKARKRKAMIEKYNDPVIVDHIMSKKIWVDQTAVQLFDTLGRPHDIDQKILKTKKKETWKYSHQGANRYGLRIYLDNDRVVGWDKKN